jgi:hypothetical protein
MPLSGSFGTGCEAIGTSLLTLPPVSGEAVLIDGVLDVEGGI